MIVTRGLEGRSCCSSPSRSLPQSRLSGLSSSFPSPKLSVDPIALTCTGSSAIGDIPKLPRLCCMSAVRGRDGCIVVGANGFGCLLAAGRFGIVEYEKCNLRGSFQVKKVPSFREVREVGGIAFSRALSSAGLHCPSVAPPTFSVSQSLVSQYMFASRISSISNLSRHHRVNLWVGWWGKQTQYKKNTYATLKMTVQTMKTPENTTFTVYLFTTM